MTPFEKMTDLYRRKPEDDPFEVYLEWHLRHAYVVSTPEFFLMLIPALKADLEAGLRPPRPPSSAPDCWYVSALAGDFGLAWRAEPRPHHEWIAFERGQGSQKRLAIYPRTRLLRKTFG